MKSSQVIGGIIAAIIGAIGGAIGFSFLTDSLDRAFRSNISGSDMYGVVLIFTVPAGLLLGGATGFALASMGINSKAYAIAGTACIAASFFCMLGYVGFFCLAGRTAILSEIIDAMRNDSLVFSLVPLWSLILAVLGLRWLKIDPDTDS